MHSMSQSVFESPFLFSFFFPLGSLRLSLHVLFDGQLRKGVWRACPSHLWFSYMQNFSIKFLDDLLTKTLATKAACFLFWTRSAIFDQQSCKILHSLCHPTSNQVFTWVRKAGGFHNQLQVSKAIVFANWFGGMVGIGCSLRLEGHVVTITILTWYAGIMFKIKCFSGCCLTVADFQVTWNDFFPPQFHLGLYLFSWRGISWPPILPWPQVFSIVVFLNSVNGVILYVSSCI